MSEYIIIFTATHINGCYWCELWFKVDFSTFILQLVFTIESNFIICTFIEIEISRTEYCIDWFYFYHFIFPPLLSYTILFQNLFSIHLFYYLLYLIPKHHPLGQSTRPHSLR